MICPDRFDFLNRMKAKEILSSFPGLIATKLHPPQIRPGIVHRKRLFEKMSMTSAKLILIAAPAGFGKSTLAVDWLHEDKRNFAWLSLDESDNDPRRFFQYFLAALQTVHPIIGKELVPVLRGSTVPSAEAIITHIVNELHHYNKPVSVILDDYYFVEEREIHRAVSFFLEHLPQNVQLIILTRVDPLLPLHRMRARGELTEIRERDLRFTQNEAQEFFETMHIKLSPEDIKHIAFRTEGWVAGLQLAAVSLQDVRDVRKFIDSFTGTNRYILDYLLEEVLNRQSREVQMFLLQTSILSRFNADICNTITGGMDARKILDHIENSNLFLIPLDEKREWFRYHHLFSELLQYRLRHLFPGLIEELYHNASVWFEERESVNDAIYYALRVKNFERVAYLLDLFGVHFLSRSELSTLINYEQKLPPSVVSKYPRLLVVKAWALMLMHRTENIEKTLQIVDTLIKENKAGYSQEEIGEAKAHIATIHAFVSRLKGNLTESLKLSEQVLQHLPAGNKMIRGLLKFNIGRIYMKQGYAAKAIETFNAAFDDNFEAGNYYVSLAILGHRGYLYSITESLYSAERKHEDALTFANMQNLLSLPAAGYIYYQYGRVMYHRNELDRAVEYLERAVHLGEVGNEPDIICNASMVLSWIYAVRGDAQNALRYFSRAEDLEKSSSISVYEADITTERMSLNFLLKDFGLVADWVKTINQSLPDDFTVIDESRILFIIRYLVRVKEYKRAFRLIDGLRMKCDERGRQHTVLQLDILGAISLRELHKKSEAFDMLNDGLESASRLGYIRVLLNTGEQLKNIISCALHEKKLSPVSRKFITELLPQLLSKSPQGHTPVPKFKQSLVEPLTEREQEVLFYLSQNMTNKDIASKIFVSLDTVKTHVKHIYGKLNVNSRQEAVKKAKELELLED